MAVLCSNFSEFVGIMSSGGRGAEAAYHPRGSDQADGHLRRQPQGQAERVLGRPGTSHYIHLHIYMSLITLNIFTQYFHTIFSRNISQQTTGVHS